MDSLFKRRCIWHHLFSRNNAYIPTKNSRRGLPGAGSGNTGRLPSFPVLAQYTRTVLRAIKGNLERPEVIQIDVNVVVEIALLAVADRRLIDPANIRLEECTIVQINIAIGVEVRAGRCYTEPPVAYRADAALIRIPHLSDLNR